MSDHLTEGTLRQIAEHSVHPENRIMATELLAKREECASLWASGRALLDSSRKLLAERDAMAAELLAKREECEELQRERDESRDLIASAMHDVGERSFLEDAQRILQGCVAPYSCEQMKAVADALRQWRDKWAILLETLVRSNEERDAAREACERKHQDGDDARAEAKRYHDALVARHGGEPIALLSELDEARDEAEKLTKDRNSLACDLAACVIRADKASAEAERLQGIIDDTESESGLYDLQIDEAAMEELPTLPDFVKHIVEERVAYGEEADALSKEAEKLRADLQAMTVEAMRAGKEASDLRAELDAVKRQREAKDEALRWASELIRGQVTDTVAEVEGLRLGPNMVAAKIAEALAASQPAQQPKPEVQP